MDISDLREEYTRSGLSRESVDTDPTQQFALWFKQAQEAELSEPNAMSLATADSDGRPNLRTVLLKYFDRQGFVFFTNYTSNKAKDISTNPEVALLFPWITLERQVIIQGRAEKISKAESLRYFLSRPRGSQLGAWCSQQSQVVSSRKLMEMKFNQLKEKFSKGQIPLPDAWGGYRVIPERFEFWQGRPSRLHDRIQYRLDSNDQSWVIERLQP